MIFYALLIVSSFLDIISLKASSETKDKTIYITFAIAIATLGIFFLKYRNDIELIHYILEYLGIKGGTS